MYTSLPVLPARTAPAGRQRQAQGVKPRSRLKQHPRGARQRSRMAMNRKPPVRRGQIARKSANVVSIENSKASVHRQSFHFDTRGHRGPANMNRPLRDRDIVCSSSCKTRRCDRVRSGAFLHAVPRALLHLRGETHASPSVSLSHGCWVFPLSRAAADQSASFLSTPARFTAT